MNLRPQTSAPLRSRSIPVPSFYPAVLALGLAILVCSGHAVAGCTLKGQGTAKSPYLVGSLSDLLQVADTCGDSASYRMNADIDASASALSGLTGSGTFRPLGWAVGFSGQFHGAGHIIQNLVLGTNFVSNHLSGLFYKTDSSAIIDSVGLTNISITSIPVGTISCNMSCSQLLAFPNGVGGISGINYGSISECFASGIINNSVIVSNPNLVVGTIYGYGNAGGISGMNFGTIRNCYALMQIDLFTGVTGEIAGIGGSKIFQNCYWVTRTGSQTICGYRGLGDSSIALTQSQMVHSASFNGFSFAPDSAWTIDEGKSYPLLRGLNNAPEALNPTAAILPHPQTDPGTYLQQIGENAILHLSTPALVRLLDITGRQIAPEVRLAAGAHVLTPPSGAWIAFVQIQTAKGTVTSALGEVR